MSNFIKEYKKSQIRSDLFYLYFSYLYNLGNLGKDFNIDEIGGLLALYYFAYDNGYLSYKHHFEYSKSKASTFLLPPNDLGFVISTGYGVCRNISFGLRDFLFLKDIKSYIANVDLREYNAKPETMALLVNILPRLFGNHLINYITSDNLSFLYNPTDNDFPEIVSYSLMKDEDSDKKYPVWILSDINNGIIMPTIRKKPREEIMEKVKQNLKQSLDLFKENTDMFEKFYKDNKDIYLEINSKVSKVKEKKLY